MSPKPAQSNTSVRQPVVVVMGHIDHGKSTLLDYIRKTKVAEGETGGITQHIGAYEATHTDSAGKTHAITFLDTPGHEAFKGIRSRGAKVADVAILVVSAEDGVKPQTVEALKSILEAKIPYIVAINKIDKPNADIEKTKQSLATNEIYLEGYGGNIPWTAVSAKTGQGVSELLDLVLLSAEILELKGSADKPANGVVIEVTHDRKRGTAATVILKNGILKKGMAAISEEAWTPIRMMENFKGEAINEALFGMPVRIVGWEGTPEVGAVFSAISTKKEAEALAVAKIESAGRKKSENTSAEGVVEVPFVIRADVAGTLEAIRHEMDRVKKNGVNIKILDAGIGSVGENDVKVASGGKAVIIGFNTKIDATAKTASERLGVRIEFFDLIYKLSEWLENYLTEKIPRVEVEEMTGRAKIIRSFSRTKDKQVVGGKVETGEIKSGAIVKVLRRDAEIGRGKIRELQQAKNKTNEVKEGVEFGAMVECKIEIAPGDRIESFMIVKK